MGESFIDAAPPRSTRPVLFDWLFSNVITVVIVLAGLLVVAMAVLQLVYTAWRSQGL